MTVIDNIKDMVKNDNLLVNKRPDLLTEWDYEKNNALHIDINMITCGSNVKAWWRCDACHGSYMMTVKNKTNGHGCPFCAGQKVLKGFNDLQSCYPDLIESEWDWDENSKNGLKPDEITKTSYVKTWWDCQKCGNKFKMSPSDRKRGRDCPYCAGKQVLPGFNDLQSKRPDLMKEWDTGNKIKPYEVTCGSRAIVCWHCNYNHKYKMSIYNRVSGHGCPYCAGSKILKGFNDLQSCRPELMKYWNWHDNNNAGIRPDEVTCGSNVEASWHCDVCNGDYMMKISMKTNGIGCPICAGKKVLKGFNDLQVNDLI